MNTLKLKKPLPEWRKHFKPGEPVDPKKVDALMSWYYPHLFRNWESPVPLKIGIHRDLLDDPRRPVTRKQLRLFLHRWTKREAYQRLITFECDRVGL